MLYKKMYGSTIMMLATMDIMVIPITSLQQHRILKNITVAREIYELHYVTMVPPLLTKHASGNNIILQIL